MKWVDAVSYVTYHPSLVLEGNYHHEEKIKDDFQRFKEPALVLPMDTIPRSTVLGWDVEYAVDGVLLTVGIADEKHATAIETDETFDKAAVANTLKKAKVLVGHSIPGDLDYLVKLGLARDSWLRGVDILDSLLLARMYNENGGKGAYGLETLMLSYFNTDAWKAETEKLIKATGNARDWSPEQRKARCRLDAWATRMLAKYFVERLLDEPND